MFVLRIIEEERKNTSAPFEQVIENFELGNAYTRLKKNSTSEFDEVMKHYYPETSKDDIDSIICGHNGLRFFIVCNTELKTNAYFIMTESGQTFERIN